MAVTSVSPRARSSFRIVQHECTHLCCALGLGVNGGPKVEFFSGRSSAGAALGSDVELLGISIPELLAGGIFYVPSGAAAHHGRFLDMSLVGCLPSS